MEEEDNLESAVEYLRAEIPETMQLARAAVVGNPHVLITFEDGQPIDAETAAHTTDEVIFRSLLMGLKANPEAIEYFAPLFTRLEQGSYAPTGFVMPMVASSLAAMEDLTFPGIADSALVRWYLMHMERARGTREGRFRLGSARF